MPTVFTHQSCQCVLNRSRAGGVAEGGDCIFVTSEPYRNPDEARLKAQFLKMCISPGMEHFDSCNSIYRALLHNPKRNGNLSFCSMGDFNYYLNATLYLVMEYFYIKVFSLSPSQRIQALLSPGSVLFYYPRGGRKRKPCVVYSAVVNIFRFHKTGSTQQLDIYLRLNSMFLTAPLTTVIIQYKADYS